MQRDACAKSAKDKSVDMDGIVDGFCVISHLFSKPSSFALVCHGMSVAGVLVLLFDGWMRWMQSGTSKQNLQRLSVKQ